MHSSCRRSPRRGCLLSLAKEVSERSYLSAFATDALPPHKDAAQLPHPHVLAPEGRHGPIARTQRGSVQSRAPVLAHTRWRARLGEAQAVSSRYSQLGQRHVPLPGKDLEVITGQH